MGCYVSKIAWLLLYLLADGFTPTPVYSQASVSFLSQRAFVTGFTPVIGPRGGVGGVDVDADGVLRRAGPGVAADFEELQEKAMRGSAGDLRRFSTMRKVSLRRLDQAIAQHAQQGKPLTMDLLFLAGLQRVEYVLVYPEFQDIVIAGPAEGWMPCRGDSLATAPSTGEMVGVTTGHAVLRLDDLLDAVRGNAAAEDGSDGISCSIDPSEAGMRRVQQLIGRRDLRMSEAVVRMMEEQLGLQKITVTGVRTSGHFARVMVGADFLMKRIAMGLERSPIRELSSFMQTIKQSRGSVQLTAPRWWLATDYQIVERSTDGLGWRFQGPGLKVMSEHGYLNQQGQLIEAGRPSPLAKKWADQFTKHYEQLSLKLPVFAQLRGCVDLAVVGALISRESLLEVAGCELIWLTDDGKLSGEDYDVPMTVPSQASVVRGRAGWIVSVSGGVDVDTWNVLKDVPVNPRLNTDRQQAFEESESWWWD